MATKSWWKNWVATICVPADRAVNSKSVVFGAGRYDGSRRDHFFQGVTKGEGDSSSLITPRNSPSDPQSSATRSLRRITRHHYMCDRNSQTKLTAAKARHRHRNYFAVQITDMATYGQVGYEITPRTLMIYTSSEFSFRVGRHRGPTRKVLFRIGRP